LYESFVGDVFTCNSGVLDAILRFGVSIGDRLTIKYSIGINDLSALNVYDDIQLFFKKLLRQDCLLASKVQQKDLENVLAAEKPFYIGLIMCINWDDHTAQIKVHTMCQSYIFLAPKGPGAKIKAMATVNCHFNS
jgi:hypothetical protein